MMRFFGRAIRSWRAGADYRVGEDKRFARVPRTIEMQSPAFESGQEMPDSKVSPPLAWAGVPPETRMLALIVEDVDAPLLRPLTHAVAYAIPPETMSLDEGALSGGDVQMGYNGAGRRDYIAPAPIAGHGEHGYVFTLLAVDFVPRFDQPPTRGRLLDAIAGHVIALAEIVGTRER